MVLIPYYGLMMILLMFMCQVWRRVKVFGGSVNIQIVIGLILRVQWTFERPLKHHTIATKNKN